MQRREFDRHSGTGRGREVKKHGAGNHNWGQEEAENHPVKTDALLEEDAAAKEVEPEVAGETPEERTGEEGGEEQSPAAPEEEAIDLETYKRMQEEKRANLPSFVSADGAPKKINTDKELEAQGYVRVVREEDDGARSNEEGQDNREDKPKKKSVNLYEYVHIEGGRIPSFGRRGGRGGASRGGPRDDRMRRGGGGPRSARTKESAAAPDLRDTQAFPTLGSR